MQTMNGEVNTGKSGSAVSMLKKEFRKGFEVPLLDHQKYGILSRVLWPSKNQVIRIIPGHSETGEILPQNINVNTYSEEANPEDYLSDTFTKATVVSRFGTVTSPFISDYEPGSPDWERYAGNTVIHAFIRNIMNAVRSKSSSYNGIKATAEWSQWCGIGPQASLSFDKPSLLMQALVFVLNGRVNTDLDSGQELLDEEGDPKPMLSVLAVDNKISMLNLYQALVSPMNPSLPLNPSTNNKYGALAELEGNKLYLNSYKDAASQHMALRPSLQPAGQGWSPDPFPLVKEAALALWHPWMQLLNFMTAEEQLELCAAEFGADTVNYVIGQDPYFKDLEIPERIRAVGIGKYANGGRVTLQSGPTPPPFNPGVLSKQSGQSTMAPKSNPLQTAQKRQPLSGLQPNATMDTKTILERTEAIRAAAGMPATSNDQAADAQDLLGDDDK